MSGALTEPARPLPAWFRTRGTAGAAMALRLPAGETIAVRLRRASLAPERRLWDVEAHAGGLTRRYLCTSWPAAKSVLRDELYRMGWPS